MNDPIGSHSETLPVSEENRKKNHSLIMYRLHLVKINRTNKHHVHATCFVDTFTLDVSKISYSGSRFENDSPAQPN